MAELVLAGAVGIARRDGIARREAGPVFRGTTCGFHIGQSRLGRHVVRDAMLAGAANRMRVSLTSRHVSVNAFAA